MLKTFFSFLTAAVVAAGVYLPIHVHEQTVDHLSAAGFINIRLEADTTLGVCPSVSAFNTRFAASDPFGQPVAGHVCRPAFSAPSQIILLPEAQASSERSS
jgi:hypothetical protein